MTIDALHVRHILSLRCPHIRLDLKQTACMNGAGGMNHPPILDRRGVARAVSAGRLPNM